MDYFGRRRGMQSGCAFTLAGAALAAGAQTLDQFNASRFLLGFGIILQTLLAPVYVTEIIPPQWRGRLGGYYNSFYFTGSITATGVVYATSQYSDTWAWRLPLLLQVRPPVLVFVGCFFIPESPRWLTSRDRMDEAAAIIYKYHGGPENEVAKLEVREVALHVKLSKPQTPWEYIGGLWEYRELFNSHPARWRTGMITLITLASSLSGNSILTFVYTPNQSLYCTEVLNQEIRAKGISLHALESNIATIFFTYTTGIALRDISWKYYFVWIAVDFVAGILWFGVETCSRTIEELDSCFEARFPPRASWRRTKIVKGENDVLEVEI
ncbi:Lactose permease [Lachnellula cervina]|uniref:Lactose permease n=1 Tax=Lachnellula cervina TaxID=1316786 RepID=A0A7D8UU09_9HELO|nr:Lactose permease [Lachnellula cervina]